MSEENNMTSEKTADKSRFISNDVWVGLFLLTVAIIFGSQTLRFKGLSKYFPIFSFSCLTFFSLLLTILGVRKSMQVRKGEADYTNPELKARPFLIALSLIVYIFCFSKIGFFVSSAIYLPTLMLVYGQRNWKAIVFTTIGVLAFLYWMFIVQMDLVLPKNTLLY